MCSEPVKTSEFVIKSNKLMQVNIVMTIIQESRIANLGTSGNSNNSRAI